ncbi:MAG: DUF2309 family protein [Bacteriovoracaceae bacterium]|nr:DUF2309 family protein [Bacteriovoracaceae bacterium]
MDNLKTYVNDVAKFLPNIRPLNEFLHLNMLPGLQTMPFWQAMRESALKYSHLPFMPISFYQNKLKSGAIDVHILDAEIRAEAKDEKSQNEIRNTIQREAKEYYFPEKTFRPIQKYISEEINHSLGELTEPLLIRLLSSFYDQGFSFWNVPKANEGFWKCFVNLVTNSYLPIYPIDKEQLVHFKDKTPIEVVSLLLPQIVEEELAQLYIEESLLSLKGWSGFIQNINLEPKLLTDERHADLYDYLAVRMVIELNWIRKIKPSFQPVIKSQLGANYLKKREVMSQVEWQAYKVIHEAYEKTYYQNIIIKMAEHASNAREIKKCEIQSFHCIDDRECSLIRFMEELDDNFKAYSTPGHFGLDFFYKVSDEAYPQKRCPAPVVPKFILKEKRGKDVQRKNKIYKWQNSSYQNFFLEWFMSYFDGLNSIFKMIVDVFLPTKTFVPKSVRFMRSKSEVKIFRNSDNETLNGLFLGYTHDEAALRLANVFKSIGLIQDFAPLVFIIGHTSTTTNNPYFTAYGCGACSGRNGSLNAKVFSEIANDPEIRKILKDNHGVQIPENTIFVSGVHDTCKDTVRIFNVDRLSGQHYDLAKRFSENLKISLAKNAKLRCADFVNVPKDITESEAQALTIERAHSIFEPRPEFGHTRNALCIVGKRASTRGLSFDRRAFLQSYDYTIDPNGDYLLAILGAAIPVCGGINLDYFYSRMNNRGIGAGSKLSHNVTGLVAISNGTEDDLLTGLALQMVELHEPMRIMFVVTVTLEVLQKVLKGNQNLWDWVNNEWVRFTCIDPVKKKTYFFQNGQFSEISGGKLC